MDRRDGHRRLPGGHRQTCQRRVLAGVRARGEGLRERPRQTRLGAATLAGVLDSDDLYTDADSNAYALNTFVGNHDMGRLAWILRQDRPGIAEQELLDRLRHANTLLFLWRGNPVVYYGDEQGFAGTGGDAVAAADVVFQQDFPRTGPGPASGPDARVRVTVPPLAVTVLRSGERLPVAPTAPRPRLTLTAPTGDGRTGLLADVGGIAQATFAAKVAGRARWTILGTDDAGSYRVFADLTRLPGAAPGERIELRVVVRDAAGRLGADGLSTQLPN